jgi:ankyrin repeat protein
MSHVWFENHITAANIMHSDSSESPNVHIRIDEVFPEGNQRKRGPGILRDAVRQDSTDIVAALLSRSFKLDSRLDDGRNVLHIAAMLGYPHVVKEVFKKDRSLGLDLLKQPGGDWDDRPIHSAAYSEHVDVIDTLSELGADLEARQRTLETALHIACEHGRPKAVYKLLSLGADPNALEMSSMTPLHLAAQNGHVAIIKHLLEFNKGGRDYLEQRCKPKGDAALHKAARCNYKFKPSYVPYSPIPYSDCDSTYLECFRVINKAGAAIDATNDLGETPLHVAASTGNVGIINFILSHLPEPKISVALSQTTVSVRVTPGVA